MLAKGNGSQHSKGLPPYSLMLAGWTMEERWGMGDGGCLWKPGR